MTYCLAVAVEQGLVFMSDSRTNAGADQINTYGKMHQFAGATDRFLVLLSSGNLATTQGVLTALNRDIRDNEDVNLYSAEDMDRVAEYIGTISVREQSKHHNHREDHDFNPAAEFILGGQIRGEEPAIVQIYPEGNFIHASHTMPFLQVGEVKYGKPILDRLINTELPIAAALKSAMVSMDSTMRSNATVGPPIEYLVYLTDDFQRSAYKSMAETDPFLLEFRQAWSKNVRLAFDALPEVATLPERRTNVKKMPKPAGLMSRLRPSKTPK